MARVPAVYREVQDEFEQDTEVTLPVEVDWEPLESIRDSEYDEVVAAIEKLPDRYREVVILSEWDGLDREEIAKLHGVKRSAIDQRMSRAYKKLERLLRHRITDDVLFSVPQAIKEGGEA